MKTALQLGGIAMHEGRVWVSAQVLSGSVADGDHLEAVGLASTPLVVDEVRVGGERRSARRGEECQLFLRQPDPALFRGGTRIYMALVASGSITTGTALRASLTWASLEDGSPEAEVGFAPAIQHPIREDTRVGLRFGDLVVPATLKARAVVSPPGGTEEWHLVLDRPLPLVPRLFFSMDIEGAFVATGEVLGSD